MPRLLVLLLLLAAAAASRASAAHLYTCPNGTGTTCSTSAPCKLEAAHDISGPGDVIHVQANPPCSSDVYYLKDFKITRFGNSTAKITYRAEGTPQILPKDQAPLSPGDGITIESDGQDIKLVGLDIAEFNEGVVIRPGATRITLVNNSIHDSEAEGVRVDGASSLSITGGTLTNNGQDVNGGSGLSIKGASTGITIENVTAFGNGGMKTCGLVPSDGFVTENTVSGVTFTNCTAERNISEGFDVKADAASIAKSITKFNCSFGIKVWKSASIQNSLSYGNQEPGISLRTTGAGPFTQVVSYNTVADNRADGGACKQGIVIDDGLTGTLEVRLFNNVISSCTKALEFTRMSNLTLREGYNIFYRHDGNYNEVTTNVIQMNNPPSSLCTNLGTCETFNKAHINSPPVGATCCTYYTPLSKWTCCTGGQGLRTYSLNPCFISRTGPSAYHPSEDTDFADLTEKCGGSDEPPLDPQCPNNPFRDNPGASDVSPAIDAAEDDCGGNCTLPADDQQGVERPQANSQVPDLNGSGYDMGAFEDVADQCGC